MAVLSRLFCRGSVVVCPVLAQKSPFTVCSAVLFRLLHASFVSFFYLSTFELNVFVLYGAGSRLSDGVLILHLPFLGPGINIHKKNKHY